MNESLAQVISSLGLSPEQARVYLILVDHGPQIVSELAIKAQVQRTYIYAICRQLIEMGLVKEEKEGKITRYSALSPDRLLDLVESKKTQLSQTQLTLEGILPTLKAKYAVSETKPVVTYYEGVEGLKKVFKDVYSPKDEPVWGCVDLDDASKTIGELIPKQLIPLRINNKVFAKSFIADSSESRKTVQKDAEALRESRLLPKENYPLPAEIDIYEDKVAMLSFARGQFVGIIIQNQEIATSLKSIFKLAFEKAG